MTSFSHQLQSNRVQTGQVEHLDRKTQPKLRAKVEQLNSENRSNQSNPDSVSFNNRRFQPAITAHPTSPLGFEYQILESTKGRVFKIKSNLEDSESKNPSNILRKKEELLKIAKGLDLKDEVEEKFSTKDIKKDTLDIANFLHDVLEEKIAGVSVVAQKPLSPDQEVDLVLNGTYKTIFNESFAVIRSALKDGVKLDEPVIGLRSWAGGDADGNVNVTPEVTKQTVRKHTSYAADLYKDALKRYFPDSKKDDDFKDAVKQLDILSKSSGVVDNQTLNALREESHQKLTKFLDRKSGETGDIANDANVMKKMLENFSLTGPKVDIRQSSNAFDDLVGHFIDVLSQNPSTGFLDRFTQRSGKKEEFNALRQINEGEKTKAVLLKVFLEHPEERKHFIDTLFSDGSKDVRKELINQFNFVKNQASKENATEDDVKDFKKWQELSRMLVIKDNPDSIERYRVSDARDATDIKFVRLLEKMAEENNNVNSATSPKLDVIPLTETAEDIYRLPTTIKNILDDKLNNQGKLTLFVGFSDIEKRMGVVGGLVGIAKTLKKVRDVINDYNKNVPEDAQVKQPVLSFGGGEDITRGAHCYKSDATMQGRQGMEFGLVDHFKKRLTAVSNLQDITDEMLEQISKLSESGIKQLDSFEAKGMQSFGMYNLQPNLGALNALDKQDATQEVSGASVVKLGDLTAATVAPFRNLTRKINVSSRAAAKGGANTEKDAQTANQEALQKKYEQLQPELSKMGLHDVAIKMAAFAQITQDKQIAKQKNEKLAEIRPINLDTERAIGVASLFSASGTNIQALSGIPTLSDIKKDGIDDISHLHVIKEVVYKTLYSAAITDYSRTYDVLGRNNKQEVLPKQLPNDFNIAEDIQAKYYSDSDESRREALGMHLENIQKHSVEATKAMAFIAGGDEAVSQLESNIKDGQTLSQATQNLLKSGNFKDDMQQTLRALGQEAEKMTARDEDGNPIGAGAQLTDLFKAHSPNELAQAKPESDDNELKNAALLLVREEQTVPDVLSRAISFTPDSLNARKQSF